MVAGAVANPALFLSLHGNKLGAASDKVSQPLLAGLWQGPELRRDGGGEVGDDRRIDEIGLGQGVLAAQSLGSSITLIATLPELGTLSIGRWSPRRPWRLNFSSQSLSSAARHIGRVQEGEMLLRYV